jgi:hypothetical protein
MKGGAVGAPVVLTLTSRPVFGFENACVAPSRMISGNFSGYTGPDSCKGSTRSDWAAKVNPPTGSAPDWAKFKFTDVFGITNPYVTTGSGNPKQLGDVLLDSIDRNDKWAVSGFASYIIAAYLNAGGATPSAVSVDSVAAVLKPAQVIHMWNDIVSTGKYYPQLTMWWDADGVIGYLQNSGIVPS